MNIISTLYYGMYMCCREQWVMGMHIKHKYIILPITQHNLVKFSIKNKTIISKAIAIG